MSWLISTPQSPLQHTPRGRVCVCFWSPGPKVCVCVCVCVVCVRVNFARLCVRVCSIVCVVFLFLVESHHAGSSTRSLAVSFPMSNAHILARTAHGISLSVFQ